MNETVEQTVFEENGVKITNLRAIIGAKTYAMSNITSVSLSRTEPSSCLPFLMIVGGSLWVLSSIFIIISGKQSDFMSGLISIAIAGVIVFVGILLQRSSKPTFNVQIGSASGETKVLSSLDEAQIRRIVDAMNEAIVRRG